MSKVLLLHPHQHTRVYWIPSNHWQIWICSTCWSGHQTLGFIKYAQNQWGPICGGWREVVWIAFGINRKWVGHFFRIHFHYIVVSPSNITLQTSPCLLLWLVASNCVQWYLDMHPLVPPQLGRSSARCQVLHLSRCGSGLQGNRSGLIIGIVALFFFLN